MKKLLLAVALLGTSACAPGPAAGFSLSIGQPGFGLFISDEAPAPYYAPPVAYVAPPPVVVHRHPVYYAPRVVYEYGHRHDRHYGWGRGRHRGWR